MSWIRLSSQYLHVSLPSVNDIDRRRALHSERPTHSPSRTCNLRMIVRVQNERQRGDGSYSTTRGRTRVPPPPPPPPSGSFANGFSTAGLDRRQSIILSGLVVAGLVAGLTSGVGGRMPSADYERELSYVASQVGVRGMPSPVSAIVDKISGRIVGVNVIGMSGQEYIATVDPKNPSVFLLKAVGANSRNTKVRPGSVYRLPTRFERIDLANRRLIETVFRVPNWETMML